MSEQADAAYPEPKIHTQAQIVVTVGDTIKKWGWADARTRKEQVAAWLRAHPATGADVRISYTIKQRSDDVPWRDGCVGYWAGPANPGLGYMADDILSFKNWGGGR